ncbi:hypothetical protein F4680DRAFT_233698 [Xylaria scruposa]|nr:hypothetical protein F4680DRAFT_233698 [Xylaria scruposa]
MAPQQAASPPHEETIADNTSGPSTPAPTPAPTPARNKRKRKAAHEYSTNPNTIRVRERNASLSPYQLAVERAKSNDMKAVASAWKDRINTESYQASSEEARRKILEDVEKTVMDRRRRKKIDFSSKISKLNEELGVDGGEAVVPRVDNEAASTSAAAAATTAGPQPPMAPPGYIAFPIKPIHDLMDYTKKKSPSDAGASAQASSSSAPARKRNCAAVQPASASASSVASASAHADADTNAKLKAAIEELNAQFEAEKMRHETDSIRQVAELQELRGVVDGLKLQLQHMSVLIQSIQGTRVTYTQATHVLDPQYPGYPHAQHYGGYPGNYAGDDGYNGNDGYATDDGLNGVPVLGYTAGGSVAGNANSGAGREFRFF